VAARSHSFHLLAEPRWEQSPAADTDILWIYGPTASGKSALALSIAARVDAVIINADASQLYAELPVLSAQPIAAEMAEIQHLLYGVIAGTESVSAGVWLARVEEAIRNVRAQGKLPLLVGGTGMYLLSLLDGIAPIPAVAPEVRNYLQAELADGGLPALYAELQVRDPVLAARLKPADTQRILRGLEVARGTSAPLSHWQSLPREKILPDARCEGLVLLPQREAAYARIADRADVMWPGAVAEVRTLLANSRYGADAPIWKTIGAAEIAAFLRGECSEDEAKAKLVQYTRNYAKRQFTWARGQFRA
jgi:tRNA dimethylallyltransferase